MLELRTGPTPVRILIVEDDAILRENLADVLRTEGFHVLTSADGRAAQTTVGEFSPDLIVCDVMLPEIDGFTLASQLALEPDTASIPIIFLTAKSAPRDLRTGLDLGAEDYLTKPCPSDKLLSVIRMRLAKRQNLEKYLAQRWRGSGRSSAAIPAELATPLRQVLGFASVLTQHHDGLDRGEIGRVAHHILVAAFRLSRKISNLRVKESWLAGLDEGLPAASAESPTCDSEPIVTRVATQCDECWSRPHDLTVSVEARTLGVRESILETCLTELLDNAFRYSRRGNAVHLIGEATPGGYRVSVRDQGPGLTSERMAMLGHALNAETGTGTTFGGLMVVHHLLHSRGIALEIESQPAGGTTMSFVIPNPDAAKAPIGPSN